MDRARIAAMVRHFPENGLKMLLEHPGNVRDLFHILRFPLADQIEFDQMTVQPATFITRDFRHIEADILLTAPFRPVGSRGRQQKITIYILIEHQSEPDRLMRFRVLDYAVQVYKAQVRDWGQANPTFTEFNFRPVLPIVFYTGSRSWEGLADLAELTVQGRQFGDILPKIEPIFLNLGTTDPTALASAGGPFGQVMWAFLHRADRHGTFQPLVKDVIRQLAALPTQERMRWQELLTYLHALVYYARGEPDRAELGELIESAARSEMERREAQIMTRTIAEALKNEGREEGRQEGRRSTLVRLLRRRFKKVPAKVVARIEAETDTAQLDGWIDRVLVAQRLEDIGIV